MHPQSPLPLPFRRLLELVKPLRSISAPRQRHQCKIRSAMRGTVSNTLPPIIRIHTRQMGLRRKGPDWRLPRRMTKTIACGMLLRMQLTKRQSSRKMRTTKHGNGLKERARNDRRRYAAAAIFGALMHHLSFLWLHCLHPQLGRTD